MQMSIENCNLVFWISIITMFNLLITNVFIMNLFATCCKTNIFGNWSSKSGRTRGYSLELLSLKVLNVCIKVIKNRKNHELILILLRIYRKNDQIINE